MLQVFAYQRQFLGRIVVGISSPIKNIEEINLIKEDKDVYKYYYHNVSHHLGLDTHDESDRELPLEPGNVITVEPGLYIEELGIGIRIEDDVLVTKNGAINLSSDIKKELNDLEIALYHRNR